MAYKTFLNGYPLTASELNNYLMNQSVMSFASSAARASAITSPVEGMLSYLEDTKMYEGWDGSAWLGLTAVSIPKSVIDATGDLIVGSGPDAVTRLGIGTSGQVLSSDGTTAQWATVGSGGMTLLSTTTLTGASTITINSISSGYKDLAVRIRNFKPSSDGDTLKMRFNNDTSANYSLGIAYSTGQNSTMNETSMYICYPTDNTVAQGISDILIPDYSNAVTWKVSKVLSITNNQTTNTNYNYINLSFSWRNTAAISSITLFGGGDFTSGSVLIYGVN